MENIILNFEESIEKSKELAKLVEKSGFSPEIIIYLETGGILVGKVVSEYFNKKLIGIKVQRNLGSLKKNVGFLLKIMPKFLKTFLRQLEIKLGVHKKMSNRKLTPINEKIENQKILIVDDAVDTGNSVLTLINYLKNEKEIEEKNIKIASLNISDSNPIVSVDFAIYKNKIVSFPWSHDSKDYKKFLKFIDQKTEKRR